MPQISHYARRRTRPHGSRIHRNIIKYCRQRELETPGFMEFSEKTPADKKIISGKSRRKEKPDSGSGKGEKKRT